MATKDLSEEFYLYLSSISPEDSILDNTSSNFENRILPINLNPTSSYEVALTNILFPRHYYSLKEGDKNSSIQFYARIKQSEFSDYEYNFYNFTPQKSIVSNLRNASILPIIGQINTQMLMEVKELIKDSYPTYFPFPEFLKYDSDVERVVIHKLINEDQEQLYSEIFVTFAPQIALVLGFEPNTPYSIFHKSDDETEPPRSVDKIIGPYPPRPSSGNDFLYIFSDLVSPTRFGNQIVNILDAIPLPNDVISKWVNNVQTISKNVH